MRCQSWNAAFARTTLQSKSVREGRAAGGHARSCAEASQRADGAPRAKQGVGTSAQLVLQDL